MLVLNLYMFVQISIELVATLPTKLEVPCSNPGKGIYLCDLCDMCSLVMDIFYVYKYLFIYISMYIVAYYP
jgi:hypothetical protein